MATRTISTKLAIEGESEYRASLTRINSEIKTLQSALKLTESQYQTNANSITALSAKGEALSNLYKAQKSKVDELRSALENAKRAEEQYATQKAALVAKIDENNKKLAELKNTTGDTSEEEKRLTEENRELTAQLEKCDANLAASEKGVNSWQTQLNNAEIGLNNLDAELKLNGEYLNEARNSSDGCATSIDRFGDRVQKSADKANELRDALAAAGVIAALKKTADALEACAQSAIQFETGMASVKRTVGGTDEYIGDLADSFKELSTQMPITTSELTSIATTAGQLGIAQDKVEQFTTVMAQLATTTDLTADNAATMLAQFSNITGVTDFDRLGAVVAELGDATATTASKVVDMSQGMAAAASIAGMSATDVLSISAAVGSLGIEAAAGSTAMSTLISTLYKAVETGTNLEEFASVAGMTAEQFRVAWGTNAAGALDTFIQGLNDTERNGKSAIVILDELGITNDRQTKAILGLASAGDLLSSTLEKGTKAWKENTALGDKAAVMYNTTEAKLTMLSNAFDNVKISIGDKLTPAVGKLADAGADALTWLSDTIDSSDALIPIVVSLTTAIATLAAGVTAYTVVTKIATTAMGLFTAILDTNPVFLAVTAIAALAAGITALVVTIDDGTPSVKELTEAASGLSDAFEESNSVYEETEASILAASSMAESYIGRLKELEAQGLTTAEVQSEYSLIIDTIRSILPDVNIELDEQTGLLVGGAEALESQVEGWKKLALQEALITKYKTDIENYGKAQLEVYENQIALNKVKAEATAIEEKYSTVSADIMDLVQKQNEVWKDENLTLVEKETEYALLQYQIESLQDELTNLAEEEVLNTIEQEKLNRAIEIGQEEAAGYESIVLEAQEALEGLSEAEEDAAEASDGTTAAMAEQEAAITSIKEEITALAQKYKEAYDAAYESIDGQIGLFDTFAKTVSEDTDTVEEMMSRWAEQTENLAQYTENLRLAAQYGLDEGLVSSLSDGSAESAGYLATIIDAIEELGGSTEGMSDEASTFVDEFNSAFERTVEAKESFAETVAAMETGLDEAIANMEQRAGEVDFSGFYEAVNTAFADVGLDFESIGADIGSGLSNGINGAAGGAAAASAGMAEGVEEAARSVLGVRSPSTVFREIGTGVDDGMTDGIEEGAPDVISAVEEMGSDMDEAMVESAKKAVEDFDKEFKQISEKTKSRIQELNAAVESSTKSLPSSMYGVGQQIVNGMISGMNSRSGSLYGTISGIVNSAISSARSAAAVASPSKKTTEIFEYVGEGMVVGLENKRKKVAETAQDVVNEALSVDVSGKIDVPTIDDRMPVVAETSGRSSAVGIDKMCKKLDAIATELKSVKREVEQGKDIYLDGDTLVGKTSRKMNRSIGKNQTLQERGVV